MTPPDHAIAPLEIMVPYVGSERLLRSAVRSVLAQDNPGWKLDVVIDGPREPSVEGWLDSLEDHRVTHHRNPTNLGVGGNFQKCLEHATGPHVVFMGCDDLLLPNYVRVVAGALARFPDAAAVLPGVEVIDESGQPTMPVADRIKRVIAPRRSGVEVMRGERLATSLMVGNWTYFPATCWNRQAIAEVGFRQDLPVTLDLALWAAVTLRGGSLVLCPETAFAYRRHRASVSSVSARELDRFVEESRLHHELTTAFTAHGWHRAAALARLRPTSRLHALSCCLSAVRQRDGRLVGDFIRQGLA